LKTPSPVAGDETMTDPRASETVKVTLTLLTATAGLLEQIKEMALF